MSNATLHTIGRTFAAVVTAALLAACDNTAAGPERASAPRLSIAGEESGEDLRGGDVGSCDSLQAPEGTVVSARMYAKGVQTYRWTGEAWAFVAPTAVLYADAAMTGVQGIHYAGPTWESLSGSKVRATVSKRCNAPGTIQWLLLQATVAEGPGIFERTAFIQRLNTTGGTAPAARGTFVGEQADVAYTAEYVFYRMQ